MHKLPFVMSVFVVLYVDVVILEKDDILLFVFRICSTITISQATK